jgi:hypothetical protein
MPSRKGLMETLPPLVSRSTTRLLASPVVHLLTGGLVLVLDWATGPFLMFPILFVVPVVLAAWYCHPRWSRLLAWALPVGRAWIAGYGESIHPWPFTATNAAIRIAVLSLIGYLTYRTARQTRELEREIKVLKGLLPICMFCKRIRDEREEWQKLEAYLSQHSEARFSHGLCPECAREHYGDYLAEEKPVR